MYLESDAAILCKLVTSPHKAALCVHIFSADWFVQAPTTKASEMAGRMCGAREPSAAETARAISRNGGFCPCRIASLLPVTLRSGRYATPPCRTWDMRGGNLTTYTSRYKHPKGCQAVAKLIFYCCHYCSSHAAL